MALFDDSHDSRTEAPTERRRKQARERGLVARSTELLAAARMLSIWIIIGWWFSNFADRASSWLRATFQHAGKTPNSTAVLNHFREQSWQFVAATSWPLLIAISAILLAHFLQVGWYWHWNNLAPQAPRLSPLSGHQRMFSSATGRRALTMLLKLTIVIGVSTITFAALLPNTTQNSPTGIPGQFTNLGSSVLQLVSQLTFALVTFGALDYGWQRWQFERSLQMTRGEVREELKEVEGDPRLKNQRRLLVHQPSISRSANSNPETNTSRSS